MRRTEKKLVLHQVHVLTPTGSIYNAYTQHILLGQFVASPADLVKVQLQLDGNSFVVLSLHALFLAGFRIPFLSDAVSLS